MLRPYRLFRLRIGISPQGAGARTGLGWIPDEPRQDANAGSRASPFRWAIEPLAVRRCQMGLHALRFRQYAVREAGGSIRGTSHQNGRKFIPIRMKW